MARSTFTMPSHRRLDALAGKHARQHPEELRAEPREPGGAEAVDSGQLGELAGRRASSSSIVRSGKITYGGTSSARARSRRQRLSASAAGDSFRAHARPRAAAGARETATPSSAKNGLGRRDHVTASRRFARVRPT